MKTAIIIPVKASDPKSRLAQLLASAARRKFALVTLSDVLEAVRSAGVGTEIFVVSSDREVLREAAASGVNLLGEPRDRGVNAAVSLGMEMTADADRWLLLPSDVPFIRPKDIRSVFEISEGGRVVISPSRELNGTNLLLLHRDSQISLSYDQDSFWGHLRSAAKRGFSVAVYAQMNVMLDIDSPGDVQEALRTGISNRTTRFLTRILASRHRGRTD